MTAAERTAFRTLFEEHSIEELQELHNMRGRMVSTIREEQMVLHEIQTEKEHVRERARSAGRGQSISLGSIDDDQILARFKSEPGMLDRIIAKLKGN